MQPIPLSEILERAIQREKDAYVFYTELAERFDENDIVETLNWLADEEVKHRKFLEKYRDGNLGADGLRTSEVVSYKIAEYMDEPEIDDELNREDVFLIAAHREKRSFEFYNELAAIHPGGEVKEILLKMANEELKHKEKMEYLYSNSAFSQTSGG